MPRRKHSPLISALIAELPQPGQPFPEDRQQAWLTLMGHALGAIYGTPVVAPVTVPVVKPAKSKANGKAAKPEIEYQFFIDAEGYAKRYNPKGDDIRIMPEDVVSEMLDLRPVADLLTIVWADGSMGAGDASLTVVSA